MRRGKPAVLGAVFVFALAGGAAAAEQESWTQRYPLPAGGQLEVVNVQGSIQVEGWDRAEVELVALKTASSGASLRDVRISVERLSDRMRVQTIYLREADRPARVDYRLRVPRQVHLEELRTVNGDIVVRDVEGAVEAHTLNGDIRQAGIAGSVVARTLNGDVKLCLRALPDPADGRLQLETINGNIFLRLPSESHADLEASTVAGRIDSELLFSVAGRTGDTSLHTRLGRGGVLVQLRTIRGSIRVVGGEDLL